MLTIRRHIESGPVPTVESEQKYEALWWLPSEPEDKVPGTVHIHPEHGIWLMLNGAFRSHGDGKFDLTDDEVPIVLGMQYSGAKFTLVRCREGRVQIPFGSGFQRQRFVADHVLIGHLFERSADVRFSRFYVKITHLKDWMRNVGLDYAEERDGGFFIPYDPEYVTTVPQIQASLSDASVTIKSEPVKLGGSTHEDDMGVKISEWIELDLGPSTSIDEVMSSYVSPLLDFFSLATAAPNSLLELKARHPEFSEERPRHPIKIHPTTDYPRFERYSLFNKGRLLFKAKDVEDRLQQTLKQWFGVYEDMEDVCDLFFGVHYNQGMTSTNRFLNVVQALETYHRVRFGKYDLPQKEHSKRVKEIVSFIPKRYEHRQWANDMLYNSNYTSLKTRLVDLVNEARPAVDELIGQTKSFAKWAKDTRNFYTHRDERSSMKVARGQRLELLTYSLLWLMRIHFMKEVGFTPDRSKELLSNNRRFEELCDACAEAPWNLN